MHDTALAAGFLFGRIYGQKGKTVIDVGGLDGNGSLRAAFQEMGMRYICVDIESHPSVDLVISPGGKLPFEEQSVDLIISTSCFEHDPCFWLTFKDMSRIIKSDGYIYVNAPSDGKYHTHPGDNWRFYSDAGQALAYWSGIAMGGEKVFPTKIVETFHILARNEPWTDFVCIWQRTDKAETTITVADTILQVTGPLEASLNANAFLTKKKFLINPRIPAILSSVGQPEHVLKD